MLLAAPFQIVLARAEDSFEVIRPGVPDLGRPPVLGPIKAPKAAMWMGLGTDADIAKARIFAESEGWTVYTYPATEPDPLGRAKAQIMEDVR